VTHCMVLVARYETPPFFVRSEGSDMFRRCLHVGGRVVPGQ
jgi:hypothetical protein